jgi:hypothetical protein
MDYTVLDAALAQLSDADRDGTPILVRADASIEPT